MTSDANPSPQSSATSPRQATALEWHLTANFHPSMTPELVAPCREAIARVAAGDGDAIVPLNGHTELDGRPLTAARLVDDLRLGGFLPGGCAF